MRQLFFEELYKQMKINNDIYALTGDLGYGGFDKIRDEFSDRFINCGAAETAMMDIACGMAIEGKIPFVYSITTFLLYRPFEVLRTYINHEKLNVKLIGSGRGKNYEIDGWSHDATDVKPFLDLLPNIKQFWPNEKEEVSAILDTMIQYKGPQFLSLRR